MQFFLGLLTAVVFFLCLFTAYWMGTKQAKRLPNSKPPDEVEKKRIKRYNEHFQALFTYDTHKAYGKKKVT